MTAFDPAKGLQSAYDFWLGMVPQFFAQFASANSGANAAGATAASPVGGLASPMDPFAKAAAATQASLQSMANAFAPMWQGAGSNPFAAWSFPMAPFARDQAGKAADGANAFNAMLAPWTAWMTSAAASMPAAAQIANASATGASSVLPLQAMQQAWTDAASRLVGATPAQLSAAFGRTHGALIDALGLGPARELQAAWQDVIEAGMAQQEVRANYAALVQRAFLEGLQRLTARLAEKADAGERVESVLALMRLWAVCTEEVVHETLQSEAGLAATAALARAALTYRKRMRHVAAIVADVLDMATRREVDEAYREIQIVKRQLRALRARHGSDAGAEVATAARGSRPAARRGAKRIPKETSK